MRISLNWLKKYVDIQIPDDDLVRLIGARLVEVEGVIDETHKYDNIYVVRVASAEKIEGTHLSLCQIDNGSDELIQVVCGAPNVREGMFAAWIAPGAIVPASVNEDAPFVIGKRKMLGKYESNGMLAGADELDFGDDHSGIVEIDPEMAQPGVPLADVFELKDSILEIENKSLTHRPDCFGIIGFAREVAGILGVKFKYDEASENSEKNRIKNVLSQFATNHNPKRDIGTISVKIDTKVCARYTAIALEKHGEIRKKYLTWQDTILSKSGMRPISPIVDATNYLMLLTGQPLHAFDYDKFVAVGGGSKPEINVRLARAGEKLVLIDDKEIELNENDIVVCSGDEPVALGGAMGGKNTEIDENTKNIIIESATFSLYNLRKTQMSHGIFSEAITRFTKGQPAYQTFDVANNCAEMLSDGYKAFVTVDEYPNPVKNTTIKLTTSEINGLLGTNYGEGLIIKTLSNVGFAVKNDNNTLSVLAPEWRTDIHIKEDVIEEVGRLLGYDNIEPVLPMHGTATKNAMLQLKKNIRDLLKSFGANEVLTYSFVADKLLKKAGLDKDNSYKIVNSISPDLQFVRQSIVPSLLDKAYVNQKIPFDKFALFEMNKVYRKDWGMDDEAVPVEHMQMGFVVAERKNSGTPYYKAKFFATKLLDRLGIEVKFLPLKNENAESLPFEVKRSAEIWCGETYLGVVGEFKNSVRHNFKLADYLAGFELNLDNVLKCADFKKQVEINYDKETRDVTIKTSSDYADLVKKVEGVLAKAGITAKIKPISIYQPDEEKRISLRLQFEQKVDESIMHELESL